jgi:hypothetical protein
MKRQATVGARPRNELQRYIKNHPVLAHEVAKVQGGDMPEGMPYAPRKGGHGAVHD